MQRNLEVDFIIDDLEVSITNSTFSANSAGGGGGGIYNDLRWSLAYHACDSN